MVNGVSTGEARVIISSRRQEIAEEREGISKRRRKLREAAQLEPTRKETFGVASRFRRLRREREEAAKPGLQTISERETQLLSTEKELETFEGVVKTKEAAERAEGERQRDITLARKAVASGRFIGLSSRQRKFAAEIRAGKEASFAAATQAGKLRAEGFKLRFGVFTKKVKVKTQEVLPDLKQPKISKVTLEPKQPKLSTRIFKAATTKSPFTTIISGFKKGDKRLSPVLFGLAKLRARVRKEPLEKSIVKTEKLFGTTKKILPEERKSFKQLIKARQFPAAVRSGFQKAGEQIFKLSTKITGQKPTPQQVKLGGKLPGETLLFGTLLGPTSSTRGQILREFAAPVKVKVVGVSQQIGQKGAITRVRFVATKGGRTFRGSAVGATKIKTIKGSKLVKILGETRGAAGRKVLTLKGIKLKEGRGFASIERGLGARGKNVFVQITSGKVAVKGTGRGQVSKFLSAGLQAGKGKVSAVVGTTRTQRGVAQTAGLLFKGKVIGPKTFIPKVPVGKAGQFLITIPKTKIVSGAPQILKPAGLLTTTSGIRSAFVDIAPIGFVSKAPAILALRGLRLPRPSKTITKIIPTQRQAPRIIEIPIEDTITATKGKLKSGLSFRQPTALINLQAPQVKLKSQQKLRTKLIELGIPTRSRPPRVPSFFPPLKLRGVLAPPLPAFKGAPFPLQRRRRKRRGSLIFSPGFTSQVLKITQRVTPKQLRRQAIRPEPIGLRKIPILKGIKLR